MTIEAVSDSDSDASSFDDDTARTTTTAGVRETPPRGVFKRAVVLPMRETALNVVVALNIVTSRVVE